MATTVLGTPNRRPHGPLQPARGTKPPTLLPHRHVTDPRSRRGRAKTEPGPAGPRARAQPHSRVHLGNLLVSPTAALVKPLGGEHLASRSSEDKPSRAPGTGA